VPDDPGPRLHPSRRTLWVAPSTVVGLVGVLGFAIYIAPGGSSSTTPPPSVITAPTSSAATQPATLAERRNVGPELQPIEVDRDPSCSPRRAPVLRVLQFNIHFGISRVGIVDLTEIAAEIQAVRPDLVSLNEVDSGTFRSRRIDEPSFLAEATGLRAVYGPNLPWEGGLFGNAILTRFPEVESHNLRLPGVPGMEPRGLLTATVRVGARTVSFSSMHLSDGSDGRTSRILQAQAVAHGLQQSSPPTILAGDLNSGPHALPVRVMRQYLLDAQEQGGTGRGDTIPEPAPRTRFDYVLYDNRLAVVPGSTRVLPSASSDHGSVFTELALLPKRGC
jgi:endonuclease/exonuclease/phosphatase family metal-dependent hydrolase